jgi:hypothetical protein
MTVTAPGREEKRSGRQRESEPCPLGEHAPDDGGDRLPARERELIDSETAGAYPVGQDQLHRRVEAGEDRHPGKPRRHEHKRDDRDLSDQSGDRERARIDKSRACENHDGERRVRSCGKSSAPATVPRPTAPSRKP